MKSITAIFLAIILMTTPLCEADTPVQQAPDDGKVAKIVLTAPSTAKIGELVRFDASASTANSYKWLTLPETGDFETFSDGQLAVFSGRTAGLYTFVLAVALEGTVDVQTFTVRVLGPPTPPVTDSIEDWVTYWLQGYTFSDEDKEALAASFDSVASRASDLGDAKSIISATAEANRNALGNSLPDWVPFLQQLQGAMKKQATAGTLTTPEQHAATWKAIARGIRKTL